MGGSFIFEVEGKGVKSKKLKVKSRQKSKPNRQFERNEGGGCQRSEVENFPSNVPILTKAIF